MKEKPVTKELAREHGLSAAEYETVLGILGRTPSLTELGIFSVMWSEHCSYKSSRIHLKKFPTKGPRVLQGPGENAGIVDIGDGLAVVFKMESQSFRDGGNSRLQASARLSGFGRRGRDRQ